MLGRARSVPRSHWVSAWSVALAVLYLSSLNVGETPVSLPRSGFRALEIQGWLPPETKARR